VTWKQHTREKGRGKGEGYGGRENRGGKASSGMSSWPVQYWGNVHLSHIHPETDQHIVQKFCRLAVRGRDTGFDERTTKRG